MKLFDNFVKKSFLFFAVFDFVFSCFSLTNQQILDIALSTFSRDLSGFEHTINSKEEGKYFELEAGLFAQAKMGQLVVGFSLDIDFYIDNKDKCFAYLEGEEAFELRSTEFDVITKDFVFECKLCRNPDKFKKIDQFRKERNILLFFRQLHRALKEEELWVDVKFKRSKRRTRSVITVMGEVTGHKKVSFTSFWVNGKTVEECLVQWFEIIEILASRSLLVMFKSHITPSLIKSLERESFDYRDEVNYEVYVPGKKGGCFGWNWGVESLCNLFKQLRICRA